MTDRPSPEPQTRSPALQRLDRLVGRARLVLWWERIWPLAWWPLAVAMTFLILSWLGLWLEFGPLGRQVGLALFALALAASLVPLLRLRGPARGAALDRLDRDAGLRHGPARALEDTIALGSNDPGSRALWDLHRRRAEAAVERLTLAPPSPGMARRDRYALRGAAILALVASAIVAGPELARRTGSAFDWRLPAMAAPAFRIDGWIDPPLYTRTPPLMIDLAAASGEQLLKAPVKSTVVIRVAGRGDVSVKPEGGLAALPPPENQRQDLREQRFTLNGDGRLDIGTGIASGVRLTVQAVPDQPPTIAFAAPPENAARGAFALAYRARDDYGIVSAEGLVEKADGAGRRSLVPAPKITLTLPGDPQADAETKSNVDLSEHPWAGARVRITLVARDEAEQEGRSESVEYTLPARPFTKPLARALVEQRRNLVLDPDDRRTVQTALDSLLIAPERFTPQWGVFLSLRMATERLRAARNDASLVEVADMLWQMALQIEEGDLTAAERELRAAQERLREAMERGASEEEIRRLTEELRQAMNNFLREFAEQQQRNQQNAEQQQQGQTPERTITQNDLNRMLNQMQEAMRRGDTAEAQRLLQELQNLLNNLQTARPNNRMTDPMAREMSRQMGELDDLARNQQELRDETFRDGQQNARPQSRPGQRQQGQQQQGQRQPGQRQPGQQGQQGQEGQEQAEGQRGQQGQQGQQGQGLQQRQQALRERLEQLQRQMRGMGMQGEQGLSDAEQAMREAEGALGQGQEGQAVDAQGRALEGLQRGAQGMAQQMQQMMGEGEGTEQAQGEQPGQAQQGGQRGQNAQRDNDPLGRPTRSRDFSDGRVRVPTADESAVQRARRILDEVRRKLGDPNRPREELDYLERLLRPQ